MYCWNLAKKDFEHNLASMKSEHNCMVAWTFFGIALLWDWNENWQSYVPLKLSPLYCPHLFPRRPTGVPLFRSDQISRSVVSDSLRPHELQHTRPPCPAPTPRVHWDSHPSSQWCHSAISSSVVPFSSCPRSFPAPGSFPMSQLFASGGQSTGVSASTSVLPMNIQDWPIQPCWPIL